MKDRSDNRNDCECDGDVLHPPECMPPDRFDFQEEDGIDIGRTYVASTAQEPDTATNACSDGDDGTKKQIVLSPHDNVNNANHTLNAISVATITSTSSPNPSLPSSDIAATWTQSKSKPLSDVLLSDMGESSSSQTTATATTATDASATFAASSNNVGHPSIMDDDDDDDVTDATVNNTSRNIDLLQSDDGQNDHIDQSKKEMRLLKRREERTIRVLNNYKTTFKNSIGASAGHGDDDGPTVANTIEEDADGGGVFATDTTTFRDRRRQARRELMERDDDSERSDFDDDDGTSGPPVMPGAVPISVGRRATGTTTDEVDNYVDISSVTMSYGDSLVEQHEPSSTGRSNNDEMSNEQLVIEAQLVSELDIDEGVMLDRAMETIINTAPEAEIVEDDESKRRRTTRLIAALGCFTVAIGVGLGAGLSLTSQNTPITLSPPPTEMPSLRPSQVPSTAPTNTDLYTILHDNDVIPDLDNILASGDDSIPEYRAWEWMTTRDESAILAGLGTGQVEDWEIVQRFVVATLYFEWTTVRAFQHLNQVFLSPRSVCEWNGKYFLQDDDDERYGVFCGVDGLVDGSNMAEAASSGTNGQDLQSRVTRIDLTNNNLSGRINPIIRHLTGLRSVSLPLNYLTGMLPHGVFSELFDLKSLILSSNLLSGSLPSSLGMPTQVEDLHLGDNNFTSTIPDTISNLTSLVSLSLSRNDLSGQIPSSISKLTQLQSLFLHNNRLKSLPTEIGLLSTLNILRLQGNQLDGTIPSELSTMQSLKILNLDANRFTGTIPSELGSLDELSELWLSQNFLTGTLPTSFLRLTNLDSLALFWNDLTGDVTTEFCTVDDDGNPRKVASWWVFNMDCQSFDLLQNKTYGVGQVPEVDCSCCYCCEDGVDDPSSPIYCTSQRPSLN